MNGKKLLELLKCFDEDMGNDIYIFINDETD